MSGNGVLERVPDQRSGDGQPCVPLGERLFWLEELLNGLHVGSTMLLAGIPGGGKSRIASQIALGAASNGIRSLVVLTEEIPERLDRRLAMMTSDWPRRQARAAIELIARTDEVLDLEHLPAFASHHIIGSRGKFAESEIIIVDSVQGDGLPANAARKYGRFYEACRLLAAAGKTIIAVGHVTKRGQLAGPRGLEHFVDLVVRVEKVATHRICATTKNRFGEERPHGVLLITDPATINLKPSPHLLPVLGSARSFLGASIENVEIQASVGVPLPGCKPTILAPGLPRRRVQQLIGSIARLPLLSLDEFDLNVNVMLPGESPFRSWLGVPLAAALIASCVRRPVPRDLVLIGELDLSRNLRPLPEGVIEALSMALGDAAPREPLRVIVPPTAVDRLPSGGGIKLLPSRTLDDVVAHVWPDLS